MSEEFRKKIWKQVQDRLRKMNVVKDMLRTHPVSGVILRNFLKDDYIEAKADTYNWDLWLNMTNKEIKKNNAELTSIKKSYVKTIKLYNKQKKSYNPLDKVKLIKTRIERQQQIRKMKRLTKRKTALEKNKRAEAAIDGKRKKFNTIMDSYYKTLGDVEKKGTFRKIIRQFRVFGRKLGIKKDSINKVGEEIDTLRKIKYGNEVKTLKNVNDFIGKQKIVLNDLYTDLNNTTKYSDKKRIRAQIKATKTVINQASTFGAKVKNRMRNSENKLENLHHRKMKALKNDKKQAARNKKEAERNYEDALKKFGKDDDVTKAFKIELDEATKKFATCKDAITKYEDEINTFKNGRQTHRKNDKDMVAMKKIATKQMGDAMETIEEAARKIPILEKQLEGLSSKFKELAKEHDKLADELAQNIDKHNKLVSKYKETGKYKELKYGVTMARKALEVIEKYIKKNGGNQSSMDILKNKKKELKEAEKNLNKAMVQHLEKSANKLKDMRKKVKNAYDKSSKCGKKIEALQFKIEKYKDGAEKAINVYNNSKENLKEFGIDEATQRKRDLFKKNRLRDLSEKFQKYTTLKDNELKKLDSDELKQLKNERKDLNSKLNSAIKVRNNFRKGSTRYVAENAKVQQLQIEIKKYDKDIKLKSRTEKGMTHGLAEYKKKSTKEKLRVAGEKVNKGLLKVKEVVLDGRRRPKKGYK